MPRIFIGVRPYFALVLLCLVLYLPGLAAVPPLDRDEARFAQATRQMVETGDLVRIHFQNTFRYKKPVGIHWLQAVAVTTFDNPAAIWPYRLPSVVGALVAVLLTFHFGQVLLDRRIALLGAALLGSSLMLIIEAHQAKTDAVLLACVVAAQGALARFYWQEAYADPSVRAFPSSPLSLSAPALGTALTFWLAQGIGVLVKGPIVPVVSGLTVIGLWGWERHWPRWLVELRPLVGLMVMTVLIVPWFVAISLATDGAFLGETVQADLLPKLLGAQESHGAPPGYFLLLAVLTFWPMSLFLWPALAHAWHQRTVPAVRFCLAWSGPVWLLFEVVPTKLPHYVLPVYPALALLVAAALLAAEKEYLSPLASRGAYFWYGIWAVLTAALAGTFLAAPMVFGRREGILWGALPAWIVWNTAWLTVWLAWRRKFLPAMATAGGGAGVAIILVFTALIPSLDALWLSQRVCVILGTAGISYTHQPVVIAGYHEPSLIFLLGTGTILSDGKGAAAYLAATSTVAIVSQKEDQAFWLALAEHGLKPKRLSTVDGLNYSRGRREILYLYIVSHETSHPAS